MLALEPQIREFTARCLDPLVGSGRFDFVNDLGEQMPMRVIGMLLGIPEEHQRRVADHGEATLMNEQVDLLAAQLPRRARPDTASSSDSTAPKTRSSRTSRSGLPSSASGTRALPSLRASRREF